MVQIPNIAGTSSIAVNAQNLLQSGLLLPYKIREAQEITKARKLENLYMPQEQEREDRKLEAYIKNEELARALQARGQDIDLARMNAADNRSLMRLAYKQAEKEEKKAALKDLMSGLIAEEEGVRPDEGFMGAMPAVKKLDTSPEAIKQVGLLALAAGEPEVAKTLMSAAKERSVDSLPAAIQIGQTLSDPSVPDDVKENIRFAVRKSAEEAFDIKQGEKAGELSAISLDDKKSKAEQGFLTLQANNQALDLLDAGMITGKGADWIKGFGKALNTAGFSLKEDEIANTEAFVASRVAETGRLITMFGAGTGLSDDDRKYAAQAAAGDITLNEKSIRKILEMSNKASKNVIKLYNKETAKFKNKKSFGTFYSPIDIPTFGKKKGDSGKGATSSFDGFQIEEVK